MIVTIVAYLALSLGIFSTMPIVSIKLFGSYVSLFSILLPLLLIFLFISQMNKISEIYIKKNSLMFLLWLVWACIGGWVGLFLVRNLDRIWAGVIIGYIGKIFIYITFVILINNNLDRVKICRLLLDGLLLGFLINAIVAIMDGLVFYMFGFSLVNSLFSDYIHLNLPENRQFLSIILNSGIRVGGLNGDPAHIGGFTPILISYGIVKKKFTYLIFGLLALIFAQSTLGLVVSIIMVLYVLISFHHLNSRKFVGFITVTIILVFIVISFFESIISNFVSFLHRVQTVYLSSSSDNIRLGYHFAIPKVIFRNPIILLTGIGLGITSYPYVNYPDFVQLFKIENYPYDPESTLITYLVGTGLFGVLLYFKVIYDNFRIHRNSTNNSFLCLSFLAISLTGLFYHYTLTAYHVIIISCACILADYNDSEVVELIL